MRFVRAFKMIGFTSDFFLMRDPHPKLPGKFRLFPENRATRLHNVYKSSVIIYVVSMYQPPGERDVLSILLRPVAQLQKLLSADYFKVT